MPRRFGAEKGHKAGPDTATTTVGENVRLKLTAGGIKVRFFVLLAGFSELIHLLHHRSTTSFVADLTSLTLLAALPALQQKDEPEEDSHSALQAQLAGRKITCRLCQGDHYTTRCPYKDTLGEVLGGGEWDLLSLEVWREASFGGGEGESEGGSRRDPTGWSSRLMTGSPLLVACFLQPLAVLHSTSTR